MIDIFLWSLAGICAGIVAGILPGIHPNTFIAGLLAVLPWLLTFTNATALAVFVISCVISNSFVSFIPSVFIGAPEAETALSVLPGHKMMLEGKGYEAVWLTVFGGISVIVLSIALALPFF
jgi:putative membrane protein